MYFWSCYELVAANGRREKERMHMQLEGGIAKVALWGRMQQQVEVLTQTLSLAGFYWSVSQPGVTEPAVESSDVLLSLSEGVTIDYSSCAGKFAQSNVLSKCKSQASPPRPVYVWAAVDKSRRIALKDVKTLSHRLYFLKMLYWCSNVTPSYVHLISIYKPNYL